MLVEGLFRDANSTSITMFKVCSSSLSTYSTATAMKLALTSVPIEVFAVYARVLTELFPASSAPLGNLIYY